MTSVKLIIKLFCMIGVTISVGGIIFSSALYMSASSSIDSVNQYFSIMQNGRTIDSKRSESGHHSFHGDILVNSEVESLISQNENLYMILETSLVTLKKGSLYQLLLWVGVILILAVILIRAENIKIG